jgi:hypothetical protein
MSAPINDRTIFAWSFFISGAVLGFLLWLIYLKGATGQASPAIRVLSGMALRVHYRSDDLPSA